MSEIFDYSVIERIKNRDFLMYQKGLDTQSLSVLCSKIDVFLCNGQYNEACQNLRIANESITRYLYTRLVSKNMSYSTGTVFALSALRKKINEAPDAIQGITLITRLENLHKPLNKYHHSGIVTAAEAQADAKIYSPDFLEMLEIFVPYVNERIAVAEASLKIEYKCMTKFSGSGEKYQLQELRANLQNVDDRSKYQYVWHYLSDDSQEYKLLQSGYYYYKLAGQKWLVGKCIKLTATNNETGHTLDATYGPIINTEVENSDSKAQESSDEETATFPQLVGNAVIECNLRAKEYDSLSLVVSSLDASNIDLQQQGIHYQWGFVKTDGLIFPLYNGRIFRCDPEKGVGKKYRCEITCDGFAGKIVSNDYGPISKSDFDIPLIGIASIAAEVCKKEPYCNDFVLKVSFIENNINGKPNYTWVYGGNRINSGSDSRHIISESDVGTEFTCEITHPKRKGAIIAGPFQVTSNTIKELTEKALEQNGTESTCTEEVESISKPSVEEPIKQDTASATKPVQNTNGAVLERRPVHHKVLGSFDGHTTAIFQKNELFNSLGKIYYFVCNDSERFILNSLEEVSYRDYLYQLLRENGYDRVVIVCDEEELHRVYAFDDETQSAAVNSPASSSPLGGMLRKKVSSADKTVGEETASPGHMGARIITEIISEKTKTSVGGSNHVTFSQFVNTYLKKLIIDSRIKTAIAMPISLLKRDMSESLANDIRQKLDASKGNNIIVLTANTVEDLGDLLSLADAFGALDSDIKKARGIAQNRAVSHYCAVSAILEGYDDEERKEKSNRKCRLIEVRPNMGLDEVVNYICKQKIIEQNSLFDNLQPYEVHSLAEKVIESIRDNHVQPTFIAVHQYFTDESKRKIVSNLIKEGTLWPRMPILVENLPSTALSRVMECSDRFAISDEERDEMFAEASSELERMIGLESVKETVKEIYNANIGRKSSAFAIDPGRYIFSGNPGTGKTEVARQMGKLLKAAGVLKSGHFVEVKMGELIGQHVGDADQFTRGKCTEALDGVLFVDEAYELINRDPSKAGKFANDYAERVYKTIMNFMYDQHRSDLCVIFAGYPNEMKLFMEADPGMERRISETIDFPDYSDEELIQILELMADKKGYKVSTDFITAAKNALHDMKHKSLHFGNAGAVEKILDASIKKFKSKNWDSLIITEEYLPLEYRGDDRTPAQIQEDYEKAKAKLNDLVGLKQVKDKLQELLDVRTVFADDADNIEPGNYIFAGNPGTGKTTVARLLGEIMKAQGLLKKGHVVEAKRKDLVGTVIGESEQKSMNKCKEALDGVLFVDEAYMLVNCDDGRMGTFPDSYCEVAYTTILQFMEDNRDRISVIFAGYTNKMQIFVDANPGMESRISDVIEFPDYSNTELVEIFTKLAENKKIQLSSEFSAVLENVFASIKEEKELKARKTGKDNAFGNAREARKLLGLCKKSLAKRIVKAELKERVLMPEDLPSKYQNIRAKPPVTVTHYKRISADMIHNLPVLFETIETTSPVKASELGRQTEKAVLYTVTDHGSGTAFLIHPDGFALTCSHVVADRKLASEYGSYRARMLLNSNNRQRTEMWFDFKVINMNVGVDMALIKLNCDRGSEQDEFLKTYCNGNFPYLKLYESKEYLPKGTKCIHQGYPFGEALSYDCSQYEVSVASYQSRELGDKITLDGEGKCGNSGSPVISIDNGLVIGVFDGSETKNRKSLTEEVNHMIPIQYFWSEFTY